MKRLLLAFAAVLIFVAPAHAAKNGKYHQNCPIANTGQFDPLVSPGQPADHYHAQGGSKGWSSTSTTADLLAAPTTCFLPGNHSAYWVPCFVADDGSPICPTQTAGYYAAAGAGDTEQVQTMALGLRFIIGNSKSTTLQPSNVLFWRCNQAGQPTLSAPPVSCPPGVGLELQFYGPKYWDGVNLDSPNHQSHVSYVKDATHQIRIPRLEWSFFYPPEAIGKFLSSDHGVGPKGRSAHMDDWEAIDPIQQGELNKCLNDPGRSLSSSPLCGNFSSATAPWIKPLVDWTNHVTYVNPNGTAAPSP